MTYSTNVPQATDPINTTYLPIAANFTILNTTFATDHVPPTDPASANWGKHKQVTLQVSGGAPTVTGTDSSIYSKTVSGSQRAFYKNVQGAETQLTVNDLPALLGVKAYGTCANNAIPLGTLYGCSTAFAGGNLIRVTFSSAASNANYSVVATPIGGSSTSLLVINVINKTTLKFDISIRTLNGNYNPSEISGVSFLVFGG